MTVAVIRAAALAGVAHGFLGRVGGVSTGAYATLNTGPGSDDDPAAVAENRHRAVETVLPGAALLSPYQVHGAAVATVTQAWTERPRADAMVTDRPGLALGILTADCAPVLFADVAAGVVGAAHAGWKGALAGVTDATLAAMASLGAVRSRIVAAVGPCIAQGSYEVDDAFAERFCRDDPANERFFVEARASHPRFDLPGYVAHRLAAAGVARVELTGHDTYADEAGFFSYRRATHRGEGDNGRQVSIIGLEAGDAGRNVAGRLLSARGYAGGKHAELVGPRHKAGVTVRWLPDHSGVTPDMFRGPTPRPCFSLACSTRTPPLPRARRIG